ncbi:hypothetical protein L2E82_32437 [Cichorium intybus]|uniref:Uncharacterized protein n=1 Tax=Cichorium intybus TaxID=13427 RepID=A0ACB9BHY9_CICIN|nr:hypothetical protein L2E82_32437 [Cichorium intybus]
MFCFPMDSESSFDERYTLTFTESSWETRQWKYDVYLNSRDEATDSHGKTFTDHLYKALVGDDIHTFRADDFDELPLSVNDLEAIEKSNVSIVVFSKEYASSRSCLDKLVKIMDCKKSIGQVVLPVFHHVDPRDIRKQSGSFESAFARHEKCFNLEKIEEWRVALTEAGNLAGWDIQDDTSSWSTPKFIQDIVTKVVYRLKRKRFVVKHPVGLLPRLQYVKDLVAEKEFAMKIFDGCGFFGAIGMSTLVDRCLVKVDMDGRLRMHDLIQDMGRKVVWDKFPQEPGKRTRLWLQDDVCNVLIKNEGTEAIECIMLDPPTKSRFSTRPFAKMPNLRLLQINNTDLVGSFRGLFKELRLLSWHQFPFECLPNDFHPKKLVSLDMQKSNLHILWRQTKFLGNLTMLDLRESKSLKTTLNFTGVPNLAELRLGGCEKLSRIHSSIGNLEKLTKLDLEECKNLKALPSSICHMKSLEELNLGKCAKLKGLPHELGNLKSLKTLNASHVGIKRLPHSIGELTQLESLNLNGCKNLKKLPSSICNLKSIAILYLEGCSSLERFPEQLGDWKGLKEIHASGIKIQQLPDSIGMCELRSLSITDCYSLKSLPNSICKVKSLRILRLINCPNIQELPEELGNLERLEDIGVNGTSIKRLPDSVQRIPYLHTLLLNNCKQLESLPGGNLGLYLIRVLALRDCNLSDNDFPNDIWELSGLMVLDLSQNNFSCLPSGLGQLHNLQVLYASDCTSLLKLPNLSGLEVLRCMSLKDCSKLVEILGLENLSSLQEIYLGGCSSFSNVIDNFFLQGYGRGLCDSKFYVSRREIPDWFEFQEARESLLLIDTPSTVEVGSFHLMIWVDYFFGDDGEKFFHIGVRVDNKTSGVNWDCEITGRRSVESCMILGPVIKSGDKIEVSFKFHDHRYVNLEKFGVHLLPINNTGYDDEVSIA